MKTISVLFLVAASFLSRAQYPEGDMISFYGLVTRMELSDSSEKPVDGVCVEFWHKEELMGAAVSARKGQYACSLPFRMDYLVKYGSAPYVPKVIHVDLQKFHNEAQTRDLRIQVDVALFEDKELGDALDFMNSIPVAKAQYIPRRKTLVWDERYQRTMKARMTSILKAYGY